MIIVTCAVPGALTDETETAILQHWTEWGNQWDFHLVDPDNTKQYGQILTRYWEAGDDFAVVEPDIVIREDVAETFLGCGCVYGCFPYAWRTDVGPALGCTWFRSPLLRDYPRLMREVTADGVGWNQLDVVLMRHHLAREHGLQPHVHLPAVTHLNPSKQLDPLANPEPLTTVPHW